MDRTRLIGYTYGFLTALAFSISPVFVRLGLAELPYPVWGTAIGMGMISLLYVVWTLARGSWTGFTREKLPALGFQTLGGITAALGIGARNVALGLANIVVVLPLTQTVPVFTLIFARLFLHRDKDEAITIKLVVGVLFVLAGSVFIILGQNQ